MGNPYYGAGTYDPHQELEDLLAAEASFSPHVSYSIGGRSVSFADGAELQGRIAVAKRRVDAADGRSTVAVARFADG